MFLSDSRVIGSLLDAEKILSNPSDVHEEWKPDASTVGGDFFRAGGAEKLELFQTVCLNFGSMLAAF